MHVLQRSLLCLLLFISAASVRAQTPTWTSLDHGLGANLNELNSVAFGNGIFVAIKGALNGGTLHYATSSDGLTWTARTIATSITSSGSAQRVRFLNGKFLIMPIGLSGSAGVALSLTSSDGLTWTSATIGTTTTSPDEMDFGNGRALAVGSNGYFIGSTDFTTWTAQSTSLGGAFGIQDVAFGGGRWFVTTNGVGEVATSTDGVTFTKVNGLSAVGGFRVEYGNNTWFFYSQQDNAVSTDGVNFTPVTRTPNTTPGGTGTIRFVNDRFLSYGPSTFQASTDGQTWTNFGAFPSLGSGFIYTAIYDFAYGNGKYVAVGGRDFPATSALIFVSDGSTSSGGGGDEPTTGTFTVAFQLSVSALPGTTAPVTGNLKGYALHHGGVIVAAPDADDTTVTLLQHKNGALSTLLNTTGGMPGGGNVRWLDVASDGTVAYLTARSTSVNFFQNGALLKVENGVVSTVIENSNSLVERGTFNSSDFTLPSVAGGAVAFIGRRGNDEAYIFKHQNGTTSIVAQSEVTVQPNGAGTGKFNRFAQVRLAADGRVFFDGYNAGNRTLPEFRRGLYVAQNGTIAVVADSATMQPGATTNFEFISNEPVFTLSPDGSKLLLSAGNNDYSTDTSERHGVYLYENGALTRVVDNSMSIGGEKFDSVSGGTITNDGTVLFYGSVGRSTNIYRVRDGTVELFVFGGVPGNTRSPGGLWVHDGQVFFTAYTSSLKTALFRKAIDGTGDAEVVIDFQTQPDFAALDTRAVEDIQFAGDLVLLNVGAVHNGIQRSAIVYGPASAVLGEGSEEGSSAPQSQAVAAGGSATLQTTATGAVQWQRNGADLAGATSSSFTLSNIQPADTGIYFAAVTNGGVTTLQPAIVGITSTAKLVGDGEEFPNIAHQNGNIFDQILLKSAAASFTADSAQGQITRLSYVDMTNDIVQVEFSGAGTVSIVLEGATTSALATNYNQPNTLYLKGHAGIVVTGADETTNLTVFTVGRGTAGNQTLFLDEVTYDGFADISFIAIQSPTGKFGGLRAANASFWNTRGYTGVYAPGIQFNGPVYVHDINAQQDATPVLIIGSAVGNTWITGGDLEQANDKAVQVAGLTKLHFKDGTTSHYRADAPLASEYRVAKANQARLERNGVDVTAELVVNP